jgi:hypothetical protein
LYYDIFMVLSFAMALCKKKRIRFSSSIKSYNVQGNSKRQYNCFNRHDSNVFIIPVNRTLGLKEDKF